LRQNKSNAQSFISPKRVRYKITFLPNFVGLKLLKMKCFRVYLVLLACIGSFVVFGQAGFNVDLLRAGGGT
jgi:hypothetical protein